METGGEAKDIKKTGGQNSKSPAPADQPTSSHPEPLKGKESGDQDGKSQPASSPPPQTPKEPSKTDINQQDKKNIDAKETTTLGSKKPGINLPYGGREERRVFSYQPIHLLKMN